MVLRFNHAPTIGYEADVGTKTTLRIVNSQVVSKPSFNFMTSPLYKNVILLAWDPSNYSSTLEQVCVMFGCHCSVIGYVLLGFPESYLSRAGSVPSSPLVHVSGHFSCSLTTSHHAHFDHDDGGSVFLRMSVSICKKT
jgi:hypothetical protein